MPSLKALALADREIREVKAELRGAARAYANLARLIEDDPGEVVGGSTNAPQWPERKDVLALVARHLAATKAFENARRKLPAEGFHILDVRDVA